MGNSFYFQWEVDLITWVQQTMGPAGSFAARALSTLGGEGVSLLVIILVLFCYQKEAGKRIARTLLTASIWFPMIKNVALRLRPYMDHPERIQVLQPANREADPYDIIQQGFSCPSGHASMSVALYGSAARVLRKRWTRVLAVVLPLLIGGSRIAVGVHYPTDVLAGWAVGLAAVGFNILLEKKVKKEGQRYAILLAMSLPGIFWCASRDYFTVLGLLIGAALAFPYEEKYVRFQDTRNVAAMILRCVGAFAIYFVLNTLLKLPFSSDFLDGGTLGANLIRTARYAVILFVVLGVYPRVFPVFEKIRIK